MLEFKKLPVEKNGECLDLVWRVFSEMETPIFGEMPSLEYKKIIDETREKNNILFYGALDGDRVFVVVV